MREGIWQTAHAGQPLFVTPPLALSRNGPAGFLWEPGTALGKGLRGKFLLNQFPSGEMSALTLEAKGASFEQTAEVMAISEKTVKRDWAVARAWLEGEIRGSSLA